MTTTVTTITPAPVPTDKTWYKISFKSSEVRSGLARHFIKAVDRILLAAAPHAAGGGSGSAVVAAAVFVRNVPVATHSSDREDPHKDPHVVEYYFSPAAFRICQSLLLRFGAEPCERPVREGLQSA